MSANYDRRSESACDRALKTPSFQGFLLYRGTAVFDNPFHTLYNRQNR